MSRTEWLFVKDVLLFFLVDVPTFFYLTSGVHVLGTFPIHELSLKYPLWFFSILSILKINTQMTIF